MAIRLRKPFSRHEEPAPPEAPATSATEVPTTVCPHTVLGPRWDNPADMGKDELASSFKCDVCGEVFSTEEALALRATEAQRLKRELGITDYS